MNALVSPPETGSVERLFDLDDLLRMTGAGLFGERENVEIIEGRLYVAPSEGGPHMWASAAVLTALTRVLASRPELAGLRYFANGTLHLDRGRVTNPDGMVLEKDLVRDRPAAAPEAVRLVVEVADASINYDERVKSVLYAEAGIAEFWIVRVRSRELHVFRAPREGRYTHDVVLGLDGAISPDFAPETTIPVGALFDA